MAIIDKGNNRFKVVVYYTDAWGDGHRKCETVTGITNAKRVETKLKAAAIDGEIATGDLTTFADYFASWLESRADDVTNGTVAQRTLAGNRKKGYALTKRFGKVKLTAITPNMVRQWQAQMAKAGLSGTTRRHYYTLLRQVLNQALREGRIRANPCDMVKPPRMDVKQKRAMTPAQVKALLQALEPHPNLHLAALVMSATGVRPGEALALRWADVDLEAGAVTIEAAMDDDGTINGTKTGNERTIPLRKDVVAALKQQRARIAALRLEWAELWTDADLVFPQLDTRRGLKAGRAWRPGTFHHQWKAALEQHHNRMCEEAAKLCDGQSNAVVPHLDWQPHELRHTFATDLSRRGFRDNVIQYVMGHAPGSKVTQGVYTNHVSAEELETLRGMG
jgi:integrase